MRTISKLTGFLGVAALAGIISCSDSVSEKPELSDAVKQYLSMRMGANNAMAGSMSNPINQSFRDLFDNAGGFSGGKIADDSSEIPPDTAIIGEPWQTCAVITELDHEDGSHTTIYDYGDGCEEGYPGYSYFMHGKYSNTYRNTFSQQGSIYKNIYFYSSEYNNYGGHYNGQWSWLMNGGGTYSGESAYDTATQKFSGGYSYEDETTYSYDSIIYYYKTKGSTHYTDLKYVIESSENNYTYGDDYYKSIVLKPLVSDYACYNKNSLLDSFCFFWMFVEGRERIQYKNGDEAGSFEIDYGDGECDNIIIIYENGNRTVVDLSSDFIIE